MKPVGYINDKASLIRRLHRVEGQVRGITGMVQDEKYCIDILTQVAAAKAALDKIALELVSDHAQQCIAAETSVEVKKTKAAQLTHAIGRML